MRRSQMFIPVLRETPNAAESRSHQLLLRGGFVRPLASGLYSMLPLGLRVKRKLENIVRQEMNAIGGQEFELPSLQPAELWRESGRWSAIGTDMLRLRDRSNREMCLAMTHEELFTALARELRSYRELPAIWYQIRTKFRDEPRPKGGLVRLREFTMKDSYSFAIDDAGLDDAFLAHEAAYKKIFARCNLNVVVASADNGLMGGSDSKEFIALLPEGEDWVAVSPAGVAENLDVARSQLTKIVDAAGLVAPEEFATPGVHTIEDLVAFGVAATQQIKTLVYMAQGEPLVVLLRGDHQLASTKLAQAVGTTDLRPATSDEAQELMGANFGSLGPLGLTVRVLADEALCDRRNMVSGANRDGFHVRGLEAGKDFSCRFVDLRKVASGELAPDGSGPLVVQRGLELGHIFKLGTRYASSLGANVQNKEGKSVPLVMGSYGIGLERLMAAIAEAHNDEKGLVWPKTVAPFVVSIVELGDTNGVAEKIYLQLQEQSVDVLWDDTEERAGTKLSEAELMGVPFVIVVGARSLSRGVVELRNRATGEMQELSPSAVVAALLAE